MPDSVLAVDPSGRQLGNGRHAFVEKLADEPFRFLRQAQCPDPGGKLPGSALVHDLQRRGRLIQAARLGQHGAGRLQVQGPGAGTPTQLVGFHLNGEPLGWPIGHRPVQCLPQQLLLCLQGPDFLAHGGEADNAPAKLLRRGRPIAQGS